MMSDLAKRTIEEVTHESELNEEIGVCFDYQCRNDAEYQVQQTHDDEPGKTFYVQFCETCLSSYTKQIDEAKIYDVFE